MGTTSKQRKLTYIREKNLLRQGRISAFSYFSMSEELMEDTEFVDSEIKLQQGESIEYLRRKFKMDFHVVKCRTSQIGDDFTKNLVTVSFWMMVKPFNKLIKP